MNGLLEHYISHYLKSLGHHHLRALGDSFNFLVAFCAVQCPPPLSRRLVKLSQLHCLPSLIAYQSFYSAERLLQVVLLVNPCQAPPYITLEALGPTRPIRCLLGTRP
eukprot:1021058-Pelagomonas_calceolata.AAC.4